MNHIFYFSNSVQDETGKCKEYLQICSYSCSFNLFKETIYIRSFTFKVLLFSSFLIYKFYLVFRIFNQSSIEYWLSKTINIKPWWWRNGVESSGIRCLCTIAFYPLFLILYSSDSMNTCHSICLKQQLLTIWKKILKKTISKFLSSSLIKTF